MKLITEANERPDNFTGIVEYANGDKFWYLNGEQYSEQEFNKKMKPTPTCNGKVVMIEGKKYKLVETT